MNMNAVYNTKKLATILFVMAVALSLVSNSKADPTVGTIVSGSVGGTCDNYGDVNIDGATDVGDALLIGQYVNGLRTLTDEQKLRADVNQDSQVNQADASIITDLSAGVRTSLPACQKVPPCSAYGDINGNGYVNLRDANLISQSVVGTYVLSPDEQKRADVNGDGVINIGDALLVGQYSASLVSTFPVCSTILPSNSIFSVVPGSISAVDPQGGTATITYTFETLNSTFCSSSSCATPSVRPPTVIREGDLLVTDSKDQITTVAHLKTGDSVLVYFKSSSAAPYALKDVASKPCSGCVPPISSGTGLPTGGSVAIPSNLNLGLQSSDVLNLQVKLQSLGYFPASTQPTGYFGSITQGAVKNFQAANNIPTTGFVGPLTSAALSK